jgi:hypothetical protein
MEKHYNKNQGNQQQLIEKDEGTETFKINGMMRNANLQ